MATPPVLESVCTVRPRTMIQNALAGFGPRSSTVTSTDLPNGMAKVLNVPEGCPVLPGRGP
jgi:hypothetical protein